MAEPIRIVHYGLGPIGLAIAGLAARKPAPRAVAAVDVDPQKAGRSLSELAGLPAPSLPVASDVRAALVPGQADVAIHCTGSHLGDVHPELVELLEAGMKELPPFPALPSAHR